MNAQRLEMTPSFSRRVAISMRPSPFGTVMTRDTASGPGVSNW